MHAVSQTDLQRFGSRVRAERERLGVSQEELADRAGMHRTYLGGVERGERNIGLLNLLRIARALGVTPGSLFEEAGRRERGGRS
jgi:transcriptional regulator with XRE-family HTH domain